MQIILSPAESVVVTRAMQNELGLLRAIASAMPLSDTAWIDMQIDVLNGILERAEGAETAEQAIDEAFEKEKMLVASPSIIELMMKAEKEGRPHLRDALNNPIENERPDDESE